MFGADGQADRCLRDALIEQLLIGQLGVGCRRGVNDERLDICDICEQGEDFEVVDEGMCFLLTALDLKGEDAAAADPDDPAARGD